MKFIHTLWDKFKRDTTLGRVVKNSGFLLVSNLISAVISIITANLVGVTVFGVIGIITSFITNVNQLLSFRMADVVVRYMGDFYARKEYDRAAAVVKAAGIMEATISIVAYLVLLLLAPLGAKYIAKDASLTPYFLIYGVSILAMLTFETASGVLAGGQFILWAVGHQPCAECCRTWHHSLRLFHPQRNHDRTSRLPGWQSGSRSGNDHFWARPHSADAGQGLVEGIFQTTSPL